MSSENIAKEFENLTLEEQLDFIEIYEGDFRELAEIAKKHPESIVRETLAHSKRTPVDILIELSRDISSITRAEAAANPNLPTEELLKLEQDDDVDVLQGVAENTKAPIELLERLSKSKYWPVREAVAINKSTPATILAQMIAKGEDFAEVTEEVAGNPNTNSATLEKLIKHKNWKTRVTAVANKNLDVEILKTVDAADLYIWDPSKLLSGDKLKIYKRLVDDFDGTLEELLNLIDSVATK